MRTLLVAALLLSACAADLDDPLASCCDGRQTCQALVMLDSYVCRRCDCLSCRNTPLALEWCTQRECQSFDTGVTRCEASGPDCGKRIAQVGSELQVTELTPCR